MRKSKWTLLLTIVLALSMLLAACGTGDDESTGDEEGSKEEKQVLNLSTSSAIPTMNTLQATDSVSFSVMNQVFEGLYRLDLENKPTPGVAESYEVSDDGTVYTFKLNPDAKWSNGDQVTSEDFVYAWRKAVAQDTLSPYASILGPIKNAKAIAGLSEEEDKHPLYNKPEELGVEAIDNTTLKVELEYNAPYFVGLTGFPTLLPQNKDFVESQGDQYALSTDSLLYNGPFVLSEWEAEAGWQLKPNDQYWDKETVKLEEVNYEFLNDPGALLNLYDTGKVDIANVPADFMDKYANHEDLIEIPDTSVYFLRFNQKNKALANVNIRKALDMAWDKETHANVILNNGSIPAYFLVPTGFAFSPDGQDFREENGTFGEYNPEKAKELWEKGLDEIGEDAITLSLLNYDAESAKKDAQYLKEQWESNLPGLTLEIEPKPFKTKLQLEDNLEYDISYAGWGPDYQDPMTFLDMFLTGGSNNQMAYSDARFDELVNGAITEMDPQKRWDAMLEAEQIFFEEQPISPMFQRATIGLQQKYIKNYVRHSFGADYTLKWVYIEGK